MYGGAAPNPFFALIEIISKLKDSKGKILIPGFYKGMKSPSKDELKTWKRLPFNEEHYRKTEVGSKVLTGEPGYSVLYRTWARPTLEVHGMPGGFTAPGAKTVIPARAFAKVSMRLVPNQDPDDVLKKYTKFVKKLTPKELKPISRSSAKGRPAWWALTIVLSKPRPKHCGMFSKKIRFSSAPADRSPSSQTSRTCSKFPA